MKRIKLFANIMIILILCSAGLYAEDLIVPVVKAPSEITGVKWDRDGNIFDYEVAGKKYKRDSFTLLLKESTDISETDAKTNTQPPLPDGIKSYAGVEGYCITKDHNYIVADTARTAGLYNSEGQKLKSYTSSNLIAGLALSPDQETLVIYDLRNTLHFYNTKTGTYIGYSPKFGIKKIKEVIFNKDSSKILISSSDNSIYVTRTTDIIFSPETIAPMVKPFAVYYNVEDPNQKTNSGITEYTVREVQSKNADESTEFITSTKEKANEKQNFDLEEEKKNKQTEVVIVKQPEQEYFPPSETEKDKEVIFSNKENIQESRVTEYKLPEPPLVIEKPVKEPEEIVIPPEPPQAKVEEIEEPEEPKIEPPPVVEEKPKKKRKKENPAPKPKPEPEPEPEPEEEPEPEPIPEPVKKPVPKKKIEPEMETVTEILEEQEILDDEEEEKKEEEPVEEIKEEEPKPKKEKRGLSEEELKALFKDGHALLFNIGGGSMKDPYTSNISFTTGYLNYNLLHPFYLGGLTNFSLGFPKHDYPYKYASSDTAIHSPYLLNIFITAPIGISIYPWENNLELYLELNPGIALYKLWNGVIGGSSIAGNFFPVYRTNIKLGAAWDFINLAFNANYDTVLGFTFEVHIGAIINIGGSRSFGSMILGDKN